MTTIEKKVKNEPTKESIKEFVSSPASMTLLMSLLAHGLTGETLNELLVVLGINPEESAQQLQNLNNLYTTLNSSGVVKTTNIILAQPKLSANYVSKINKYCSVEQLDLTSSDAINLTVKKINKYVSDNTNKIITKIIHKKEITPEIIAILMNTIYFKDEWAIKFDKRNTNEKPFYSQKSERIEPFMSNKAKKYNYYQSSTYQHLEMEYLTNDFYFGLVLPLDKNSLPIQLAQTEIFSNVKKLVSTLIDIKMPIFSQETEVDLIPLLKSMGVKRLFSNAESNIFEQELPVFINMIKQKTKIIINETGTEAAAVTIAGVCKGMMKKENNPPIQVTADHPFTYYIRYHNVILFEGAYM